MSNTILLVDDNLTVRRAIRSWIEWSTDWNVCGEAENGAVAVEKARALLPDVVILDLAMPVMNGLEAARQIARVAPHATMVMFTMHAHEQLVREARAAGIHQVVSKTGEAARSLISAIQALLPQTKAVDR
jgi:DNA-binding NarL/FixJ family response regulator